MKFDIVWEECIQEDVRVTNREDLLREYDQALATHTKRRILSRYSHPYQAMNTIKLQEG